MANPPLLEEIDRYVKQIPIVPNERRYWLIRTESGIFYDDFIKGGYIAIGYDKIGLTAIQEVHKSTAGNDILLLRGLKNLSGALFTQKDKPGKASRVAGQLYRFIYGMQTGDVVLIPSENSEGSIYFQPARKNE